MPQARSSMRNIGVVFGGVSPEHEVSIISAHQAMAALDRSRYQPVPLYIAKDGRWYTGDALLNLEAYQDLDQLRRQAVRVSLEPTTTGVLELVEAGRTGWFAPRPRRYQVEVLLLGLHGGPGENGSLQGLCETFNVPYTGAGVFGSALGMDKVLSKLLCREQGIPVVEFVAFRESEWVGHEDSWLDRCRTRLGFPVIVKPARLGSSIGIAKADDRRQLDAAIEEALRYDDKVIVEQAVPHLREVNCAVLGDPDEALPSVLEEPVRSKGEALLTFQEKYMRGAGGSKEGGAKTASGSEGMASLDRIIPAPLPPPQTEALRALAVRIFQLFECAGVARLDFLLNDATGQYYFNEINTIPGSFSFYLWQPTGIPFDELTHRMIELACKRHQQANRRIRTYDVNLLSTRSLKGVKGQKG